MVFAAVITPEVGLMLNPALFPDKVNVFAPVPLFAVKPLDDAANPTVLLSVAAPVNVIAAFTMTVTINVPVIFNESVAVIVS